MFTVFNPARKTLARLAVLASAMWLAACEPTTTAGLAGGPSVDTSKPIPVALLVPKSEPNAAGVAQSLENAARLAVADLGGVAIDLRVYDTAGNAQTAAAVGVEAVNDGAKIIIGPLFAEAANSVGVAVAPSRVNVLSFSNNSTIAGGNVFILGSTFRNTADRVMSYAASRGIGSVVVAHPNNLEGQLGRNAIQQAGAAYNVDIAAIEGFEFSQPGVVAAVPRIRDAVRTTGADALFMTSNSAGALPLLGQLLPEAGVDPAQTRSLGLGRWDVPVQNVSLPALQGGWFALPDESSMAGFRSRYQSAYGATPHPLASLAYDGIAAVGALAKSGKANALSGAALTQGAGFQGVGGIFRLRADGTNERGLAVAEIRNKQVVIIEPAPRAFGGPGF